MQFTQHFSLEEMGASLGSHFLLQVYLFIQIQRLSTMVAPGYFWAL